MRNTFSYTILILLLSIQVILGQKKEENIGTEVVNVVKPYTPSVSDAFKVKETPIISDEENSKKEEIKYSIFSYPVASTFSPTKGTAEGVEAGPKEQFFKNYVSLGAGNYSTLNAELYLNESISDTEYVGAMLRHLSSQGGVKNAELNNSYYNSSIDLTYGKQLEKLSWNTDIGFQNQIYNWYGLPENFGTTVTPEVRTKIIDSIAPRHRFNDFYLGGKINLKDSNFTTATINFDRYWDARNSTENRFYVKPSFEFDVAGETIKSNFILDYVGGSFAKDNSGLNAINYEITNFGFQPSIVIQKNDWTFNLGTTLFFSFNSQANENKMLVYPKINGSFKLVENIMTVYFGADGGLIQNTSRDFSRTNPFVAPSLFITPTDQQFDVYLGLKGKIATYLNYNFKASYINEKNKALFKSNDYTEKIGNEDYGFGNSFQVIYDEVKTVRFFGELVADFSKNVSLGFNGTFNNYQVTNTAEAWNLPNIVLGTHLKVDIDSKWETGLDLFYVGARKDMQLNNDIVFIKAPDPVTLPSYFDANASVTYKLNNRLLCYLKLNNFANQTYQRWLNFTVQGFQALAGASYNFDF